VRIYNPVPNVITDYVFTFSADAEFSTTDILVITFPSEIDPSPSSTVSRNLATNTTKTCTAPFTPYVKLNCSVSG